ncbi:MAG: hypothetical protein R3F33_16145 [Planctomycetota bacterium]
MLRTPLTCLALLPLFACVSPARRSSQEPEPAAPVAEEKPEAVSGAERRELELQAAGLRRELEGLNEELAILRNSNAVEQEEGALAVAKAERAVTNARDAWNRYREVEAPLTTARAQLEVERNVHQVESARQELEGILEIYDGEPEGRAKQEIVRRNRKQYELAQKELENARMEARRHVEFEIPAELREHEAALADAESELELARVRRKNGQAEAEHAVNGLQGRIDGVRGQLALLEWRLGVPAGQEQR